MSSNLSGIVSGIKAKLKRTYEYNSSLKKDRTANSTSQVRRSPSAKEEEEARVRWNKRTEGFKEKKVKWGIRT